MIDQMLNVLAPHHCCGCQKIGTLLCDSCYYDIIEQSQSSCLSCTRRLALKSGLCTVCRPPYQMGWSVGDHEGTLDRLIDLYKFSSARQAAEPLARLMSDRLPDLPTNSVIVPLPTIRRHIRERGFDHSLLIAKQIAAKKQVEVDDSLLRRRTISVQREQSADVRRQQASVAFMVSRQLDSQRPYILFDDVMTTGSSLWYAAKIMKSAGARQIWLAVIARHIPKNG